MDGIELACRYSFQPNKLGLCGPANNLKLFNYVTGKYNNKLGIKKLLEGFEAAFAYYTLIARSNRISNPFDYRVIEAYWIGNDLLKKVTNESIKEMIVNDFTGHNFLDRNIAINLARKMPQGLVPHHSFHVFYLGSITGRVPKNLQTFNSCYISWGQIKKIENKNIIVLRKEMKQVNKKIILNVSISQKILFKVNGQSFIKNPHIGDFVSIHWNWACDILSKKSLERLKYWTTYNLRLVNGLNR